MRPRSLILRAPGTNCDEETAAAWQLAGADAEVRHVARVVEAPKSLDDYQFLTIPGGFSYGDDLGAGRIFATRIGTALSDAMARFRDRGGLLLGVCNGFQVLVRAGLLPGGETSGPATLARNTSGTFQARWVRLAPRSGVTPFLDDDEPIELPVAHGEGRFLLKDAGAADALDRDGRIVLKYVDETGQATSELPGEPQRLDSRRRRPVRPHRACVRADAASRALRRPVPSPAVDPGRSQGGRRRAADLPQRGEGGLVKGGARSPDLIVGWARPASGRRG